MSNRNNRHTSQQGVVSIFVVIFSTLLITIVTISFVQLMIRNQQEAATADLSASAYDSALAGVEDAKQAIVTYNNCQADSSKPNCLSIINSLNDGTKCNAVAGGLGQGVDDNYKGSGVGDEALNQAYTCAKLLLDTPDYIDELTRDGQHIVPLKAVDPAAVTTLQIEWSGRDDTMENGAFTYGSNDPSLPLPTNKEGDQWAPSRPPIVEAQFMQLKSDLSAIDNEHRTLTLYPIELDSKTITSLSFDDDLRKSSTNKPYQVDCKKTLVDTDYACRALITLPANSKLDANRQSFLRIATRYNSAHYRISMLNTSGTIVKFDNVQPEADVTGRAGDVFRRVSARITPAAGLYPEAAVDINGNLCKTFFVTGSSAYYEPGACTP